jgi:hypothetical protein
MTKRAGFSLAVLATAILLLCQNAPRAFAQDYPPDQPEYQQGDQDPPTRAGRLSFTEGSVSFQPGGEGDWLDAVRNRPLTVGDNLWVDRDSRAEIQIGSTSIRLGPETSVTFLDLGNNVTQLRLSLGSVYVRVRRFDGDDAFEVDTPNLAFNVNRAGTYRIDTNENGDQTIADVFRGEAEITGSGNSYRLDEGQEGTFSGTDQLSYDVSDIQSPDDFGRWAESRDERMDRARSREYVSQDMTGYEDLDDYGSWRNDPEYGNVWQPAGIPGDWAPYRYGHWAYVSPWGWTWVEDEPWGFAPFHYGRWAFVRSSWCWVPGPVAVAPVYAPALVAFVGGAGFSVGIGIGSEPVGWFPLGPREVYVPWYRSSPRYVQNVNVTNTRVSVVQVTNVYNNYTTNHVTNVTYVNRHVNNSVTVVNHDTFVNARPVNRNIQRVDARQLANARVTPAVVRNVRPSRQSFQGVAHPVQYRPPQQAISRPVVATRQPVVYNRPANRPNGGPGGAARPTPPPVRTVHAAPPAQVQPLQRGARGGPNPPAPGGRPGQRNGQGNRPGQPNNPGNRPGQPNGAENRPGQPNNGQPNGQPNRPVQPNAPENRGAAPRPAQPNNGPENRPGQPNRPDNRGAAPRPGQPNNGPDNRPGQPNGQPNRPGQPNAPENRGAAPRPGQPNNGPDNRPDNRPGEPNNRNVPRPGGPGNGNPGARPNDNAPRPGAPDNRPAPPETRNAPGDNGRPGAPDNRNVPAPNNHNVPRPPSANSPEQQPRQYPGTRPENNRPQEPPQARPDNRPESPQMRPQQPSRPPETPQTRPEQPARPPETRQQQPPQSRPDMQRNSPPPQARPAEPPPQREARPMPPPERESRPAPPPQREARPMPPPERESRPAPPQRESRPAEPPPQRESRPAPPPQRENHPAPPPKDRDKEPPKSH